MHTPVLVSEVLAALDPQPGQFIIDGTVGGGGHARTLIQAIGATGTFLGIDWNASAVAHCQSLVAEGGGAVRCLQDNFAQLPQILKQQDLPLADALLVDLGISSDELEQSGRGFSFRRDEPLLMTYADDQVPVRDILRQLTEIELATVIKEYGEERWAARIARVIKESGRKQKIATSGALAAIIARAVPSNYEHGRIHPATRTFQALRIYANQELENIQRLLDSLPTIIKPNGRVAIISFHSLEDRLVKRHFQQLAKSGHAVLIHKKPVTATRAEISANPRSRSAKLRAIQLLENRK